MWLGLNSLIYNSGLVTLHSNTLHTAQQRLGSDDNKWRANRHIVHERVVEGFIHLFKNCRHCDEMCNHQGASENFFMRRCGFMGE